MTATIEERIAKGAALLDEKQPGWAEKVNIHDLDMNSTSLCVLGQVFGYVGNGMHALDIDSNEVVNAGYYGGALYDHGFGISLDEREEHVLIHAGRLRDAWRTFIITQREVAS